jgi:hypothetical protein
MVEVAGIADADPDHGDFGDLVLLAGQRVECSFF